MAWNKIDNLLKKTEAFYKKTLWEELLSKSQRNSQQIKTAETHEEKKRREEKEAAARRKALSDQAKLFLEQHQEKKPPKPTSILELTPEEKALQKAREEEEAVEEAEPPSGVPGEELGLYNDIKDMSKEVTNITISDELFLIAELYKQVVRSNTGFNFLDGVVRAAFTPLSNEYDQYSEAEEIDEESGVAPTFDQIQKKHYDAVENLLDTVKADIRQRANVQGINVNRSDSDEVRQQFKTLKDAVNAEISARHKSKEGLTQGQLADLESGGVDPDDGADDPKGKLDKGEIAGKKPSEDGAKAGMGVMDVYAPKEWAKSYKGEMDRYTEELSNATDPTDQKNLTELIATLKELHVTTVAKEKMQSDPTVSWTVKPRILSPDKKTVLAPRTKTIDDPAQRAQYDEILQKQQALKQKKTAITSKLRVHKANKENVNLHTKLATAGPKEKRLLEQQIALNELVKSPDRRKTRELRLRKQLVTSLGGNIDPTDPMYKNMDSPEEWLPNVPEEHIQSMMAKIAEASTLRVPMSVIHKEQADKIKQEFQYYGSRRGHPISVEGIFIQFNQSIPNIKHGYKKKLIAQFRSEKTTTYLPFRDAISNALQSGDAAAVERAEKAFDKQLKLDAENHPMVQSFIAYSKAFITYLEEMKALHKKELETAAEDGTVLLSTTPPEVIQKLLIEGKRLFALEMSRNPGGTTRGISNVAKAITIIIKELEDRLQGNEVKTSEGFNKMNIKQKLAALKSHFAREELKKMAEGNVDTNFYAGPEGELTQPLPQQLTNMMPAQQMSKAEADAKAEAIMDNIIDNLKIKGLDY